MHGCRTVTSRDHIKRQKEINRQRMDYGTASHLIKLQTFPIRKHLKTLPLERVKHRFTMVMPLILPLGIHGVK